MEKRGEECQKTTKHLQTSRKKQINLFPEDCNESIEHARELDKRNEVKNSGSKNRQLYYAHYLEVTETKSDEPLEHATRGRPHSPNVNIHNNELFTAPFANTCPSKEAHCCDKNLGRKRNSREGRSRQLDVVGYSEPDDSSCYYFVNGDLLVRSAKDDCGKNCVYSKLVPPKLFGISPDKCEREHVKTSTPVRVCSESGKRGTCGEIDAPLSTNLNACEETNMKQPAKVKPMTKNTDSSLQAGSPTLSSSCRHSFETAITSNSQEIFSCRFCDMVPDFNVTKVPTQTNSILNAHSRTLSQSLKEQDLTDNTNSRVRTGNTPSNGPCKHGLSTVKKSASDDGVSCRICHSVTDLETLVSPCQCTGSMKYVHESCLLNWLKCSVKTKCELCLHEVAVRKLVKPLNQWRLLDEKPVALIWLVSFLILLTLNILSVIKDASRGCTSTTCIVFYVLGCTGAILGVIFLWFWARKSAVYFKKLLTLNQVWLLEETCFKTDDRPRNFAADCNV